MKKICWKPGRYKLNVLPRESTRTELRLSRLRKLEWRKWLLVCVLWLVEMFATSSFTVITPFFPAEAEQKNAGALMTGVILSASGFSHMICSPLFGYILPKLGTKITLICGIFLIGVAVFSMRFLIDIPSGWVFIISAVLMQLTEGIGWAMYMTSCFTILAQLFPNRVATVTGVFEVASSVGYALGRPIGGILYDFGGFTLPFTLLGVTVFLLALPTMALLKPTGVSPQPLPMKTLLRLLSNVIFAVLLFSNVNAMIAMTYYEPTVQLFLLREFGLNPLQIGLLFLPYVVINVPLALAVGRLSDKFGARKFVIGGLLIGAISQFFIGPADFITKPQLWIVITAFLIQNIGVISINVTVYSDMLEQAFFFHPNEEITGLISVVSGLVAFSTSLGEVIGPTAGGAVVEISDFPTSSVVVGEVMLAQGFLLLGITLAGKCFKPIEEKTSSNTEVRNAY